MKKHRNLVIACVALWLLTGAVYISMNTLETRLLFIKTYSNIKNGKHFYFGRKFTIPDDCFMIGETNKGYAIGCIINNDLTTVSIFSADLEDGESFSEIFADGFLYQGKQEIKYSFLIEEHFYYILEEKLIISSYDKKSAEMFFPVILGR